MYYISQYMLLHSGALLHSRMYFPSVLCDCNKYFGVNKFKYELKIYVYVVKNVYFLSTYENIQQILN